MKAFKTVNSKLLSFLLVMVLLMGCFGSYVSYVRADDEKIPDTTEPTIGSTENTEPSETTTAADTQDSSTTVTTTTEDTDATTTADPDTTATTTQETTGEDITDETTTEDPGATTTESVSEPAAEPYIGTTAEETAPLYVPAFDGNGRMVDYNGHQVFMLDGAYYELVDG
ncbi:MAG: hypothetical protein FWD71_23030, partial [Oscillospiraceae bacterium]|nr:hypothetical protein [Oscillospiraceae bacterium]